MQNEQKKRIGSLKRELKAIYLQHKKKLPFHGWHHIEFVTEKAVEFGKSINANLFLVEASALTHDLNYIVTKNSEPEAAAAFRHSLLSKINFNKNDVLTIEKIILEAHTNRRTKKISAEAKALSDADTLFKALPITPIIYASKYLSENRISIEELAKKIIKEQEPLMEKGIYFYTDTAKKRYSGWAATNLKLWKNVIESLDDKNILKLLVDIITP